MRAQASLPVHIPHAFVTLPDGSRIPAIGQGTFRLGDGAHAEETECAALRAGALAGAALVDTAEAYGDGRAERVAGRAVRELRAEGCDAFVVSKVVPENARRERIFASCDASLERLGIDALDLYLLHWRGGADLGEVVGCMEELVARGLVRRWGVSNFDVEDMEDLLRVPGGEKCAVNQVLYHLGSRGIEHALLPWLARNGIAAMAYCPLAQGGHLGPDLLASEAVRTVARRHGATEAQVLLAFCVRSGRIVAIAKAATEEHARENAGALGLRLAEDDLALLDEAFPPPDCRTPLDWA